MTEQKQFKPQTLGNFNITGFVEVDDKTFSINSEGKNNKNWISNVFNPKITSNDGKSMFVRFQDGFDKVKGKDIYASPIDGDSSLIIPFADRFNENIVAQVDEKSFIKIGLRRVTKINEDTKKEYQEWEYKKFLTVYDAINFMKDIMQIGEKFKIRVKGRVKYQIYNGNLSRNYELQTIYLLPEDDDSECDFLFSQDILLTKDVIDKSKWEEHGIITVNAKVYQKKKKDVYEVIVVPMIIRAGNKRDAYNMVVDRYFDVKEDIVRRIRIEGRFNCGYIAGEVKKEDLPQDALELIELGLYTEEEILKKYAVRDRIDEVLILRPVMQVDSQTNLPKMNMSDVEYTLADLENLVVEAEKEEEITLPSDEVDAELLNQLNDL